MKKILVFISLCLASHYLCMAQTAISGRVLSADDNQPLPGASVKLRGSSSGVSTDSTGRFTIEVGNGQSLVISYIGYFEKVVLGPFRDLEPLIVRLAPDSKNLKEVVVSTGYQDLARERSTGSCSKIGQALFESRASADVLSRLENLTSSLSFDRRDGRVSPMAVRGRSTILSNNEPLVVVDNFPYDGDLRNLNPNDIESVTVLKDAAAAAIWGARAGNGVIVINTKRGGTSKVEIRSNVTVGSRPDLYYDKNFLSSGDFIDVEKMLFERNFYSADENAAARPALSPAVEIMIAERDGIIAPAEAESRLNGLRQQDVRRDFDRYVYRNPVTQQHALAISGGGTQYQYYFSGGYDRHLTNIDQNRSDRITLTSFNTFKPIKKLEVDAGLSFSRYGRDFHDIEYGSVVSGGSRSALYPYAKLRDESGTNLPI
ncbi:MAG TPA: carboxypeptidase-like regulatory domain-containing protein, partial [Sphingobacteriaceae bacterium]